MSAVPQAPEALSRSYKLIEVYIKIACKIAAVPFDYVQETLSLKIDRRSGKYKAWWFLMLFLMFCETSQVIAETLRSKKDPNVSRGEWSLVLFVFLSWCFIFSLHVNAWRVGEEMATYHHSVVGIRTEFGEKNLPHTSDDNMIVAHICSTICQYFFQSLMVAAEGSKGHYLYSNIPTAYRSGLTVALWFAYSYYRVLTNFMSAYFSIFTGVFHVQTCNQILRYRILKQEPLEESLRSYRLLQVLSRQYEVAYSTTFLPEITLFSSSNIILGLFGALRYMDSMEPHLYLNFPLMAVMMGILAFTFFPNNASIKEISQWEPKRILAASMHLEIALNKLESKEPSTVTSRVPSAAPAPNKKAPAAGEASTSTNNRPQLADDLENIGADLWDKIQNRHKTNKKEEALRRYLLKAKCIARSCPIVAVRMGTFYAIKQSTVLTIFDFIFCNTISALLTWK